MNLFEIVFEVTETCMNGNERRLKKSVYSPRFGENGRLITEPQSIAKGVEVLKQMHYYDITYIKTKAVTLLMTEDLT